MFAFIDESGHTGSAIDDEQQPTFNTLAIFSKRSLDILHKSNIERLCAELGVKELHGAELGDKLEYVAASLYPLFQSSSPEFFLCSVDKDYLAITKNVSLRSHKYKLTPYW
jgi:hypothetical protein